MCYGDIDKQYAQQSIWGNEEGENDKTKIRIRWYGKNSFILKKPKLEINFVDGPYACLRDAEQDYLVEFINQDTGKSEYSVNLKNNHL